MEYPDKIQLQVDMDKVDRVTSAIGDMIVENAIQISPEVIVAFLLAARANSDVTEVPFEAYVAVVTELHDGNVIPMRQVVSKIRKPM